MLTHQNLNSFGWVGVTLFFVLSGFLITKVLFAEKQKTISLRTKLKNFWMRRILRIFPVYYLYLIILLLVTLFVKFSPEFINSLPYLTTYTYNFYLSGTSDQGYIPVIHFWSLSVEEQFYLFYPFLILLLKKKHLKFAALFLIASSILFRFIYSVNLQHKYGLDETIQAFKMYYSTFSHIDSFLIGGCIAIFELHSIKKKLLNILFFCSSTVLLISGLFLFMKTHSGGFYLKEYLKDFGYNFSNVRFFWLLIPIDTFFFCLILNLVAEKRGFVGRICYRVFSFSWLVYIGQISYGMYVIHRGCNYLFSLYHDRIPILRNGYIYFTIYFLIVFLIALCSYEFFEKRFLKLKDNFR